MNKKCNDILENKYVKVRYCNGFFSSKGFECIDEIYGVLEGITNNYVQVHDLNNMLNFIPWHRIVCVTEVKKKKNGKKVGKIPPFSGFRKYSVNPPSKGYSIPPIPPIYPPKNKSKNLKPKGEL